MPSNLAEVVEKNLKREKHLSRKVLSQQAEIVDEKPDQEEDDSDKALRQQLIALKQQYDVFFNQNFTLIIPPRIAETKDTVLLHFIQKFNSLKSSITTTQGGISTRWNNGISTEYLQGEIDNLNRAIETINEFIKLNDSLKKRSELLYPETSDLYQLKALQSEAHHQLNQNLQDFLFIAKKATFEEKNTDAQYLNFKLSQFRTEMTTLLNSASSSEPCLVQHLTDLRTLSNLPPEKPPTKLEGLSTTVQTTVQAASSKVYCLVTRKPPKKEPTEEDTIRMQIPIFYQAITKIQEFPIYRMYDYLTLISKSLELDKQVEQDHAKITLQTNHLIQQLTRLAKLFTLDYDEYGAVPALQETLRELMALLDYKLEKNTINREQDLTSYLTLSIDELSNQYLNKQTKHKFVLEHCKQTHQLILEKLQTLHKAYLHHKNTIETPLKEDLANAKKIHQLLSIPDNADCLARLNERHDLHFVHAIVPVPSLDPEHLESKSENQNGQSLKCLQDIAESVASGCKAVCTLTKAELVKLQRSQLDGCRSQFMEKTTSVRPSSINPFRSMFTQESFQLYDHINGITAQLNQKAAQEITGYELLRGWNHQFDSKLAQIKHLTTKHEITVEHAQNIEDRLQTPAYLESINVLQTIKTEYSRIFKKYYNNHDNLSSRQMDSMINKHFELVKLNAKQKELFNEIDPRLAQLLLIHRHLTQLNQEYINLDLKKLDDDLYIKRLLKLMIHDFQNNKLEHLSDNKHLSFVRIKVIKPLYLAILQSIYWIKGRPIPKEISPSFFQTPFPCITETTMLGLRERTLNNLSRQLRRLEDYYKFEEEIIDEIIGAKPE